MSSTEKRYPLGTVALYGPTDKQATKLVASIYPTQRKEPAAVKKWNSAAGDIREDEAIQAQLAQFLQAHQIAHAVVTEEVVGCPHEPGIDYPSGSVCPLCPFWAARPRSSTKQSLSLAGRNDPCPCGSGRKFKKCCGANA